MLYLSIYNLKHISRLGTCTTLPCPSLSKSIPQSFLLETADSPKERPLRQFTTVLYWFGLFLPNGSYVPISASDSNAAFLFPGPSSANLRWNHVDDTTPSPPAANQPTASARRRHWVMKWKEEMNSDLSNGLRLILQQSTSESHLQLLQNNGLINPPSSKLLSTPHDIDKIPPPHQPLSPQTLSFSPTRHQRPLQAHMGLTALIATISSYPASNQAE